MAAPEWRGAFVALMGDAGYQDALRIVQVAQELQVEGDWLVAAGCQPHACDIADGAVAVSLTTGRIVVALWEADLGLRVWGDVTGSMPRQMRDVLARR
jgi:hypothetical protein